MSMTVSDRSDPIRVVLPFEDQASADIVRAQLEDLSHKIHTTVQPVFVSQKIEQDLKLPVSRILRVFARVVRISRLYFWFRGFAVSGHA